MTLGAGRVQLWVLSLLLQVAVPLPILPEGAYCLNASVQLPGGGPEAALSCDPGLFNEQVVCCEREDVQAVLEHLEHTLQFGLRHLQDRHAFLEAYRQASFGQHPCLAAMEELVDVRLRALLLCQTVSQDVLKLLSVTVEQALCSSCCDARRTGGAEDDGSAAARLGEVERGLTEAWRVASVNTVSMYEDVRAADAAVAAAQRGAGREECVMEYVEGLRRGVQAPASHSVPFRSWRTAHGGRGAGAGATGPAGAAAGVWGFREAWRSWIDGLLGVASELAEGLMAEVEGLLLAYQYSGSPGSGSGNPAFLLLAHAPPDGLTSPAIAGLGLAERVGAGLASGLPAERRPIAGLVAVRKGVLLLVALPNPGTNLRFDFANDPAGLSDEALLAHARALEPLAKNGPDAVSLVVITPNPDQAASLRKHFDKLENVHVVWRRFALFHADELASLYASDPRFVRSAPATVAVFEVPPGGAADTLAAAAVALLITGHLGRRAPPSLWPPPLRPAHPSAWVEKVEVNMARRGRSLAARAALAGEGPCPTAATALSSYLAFHRAAREQLLEEAVAGATRAGGSHGKQRVLIYRCSSLGFCGGHGDRLNGLLGLFLLAVASRRAFFIDSPRPVPLQLLLSPRRRPRACGAGDADGGEYLLDWRMHGAVAAVGRRVNYNDRYNDLVADLPWFLADDGEPVVVFHSNQRITAPLLRSAEARALLGGELTEELLGSPFLHADLLELLFEPTPLLANRHSRALAAARGGRKHLIAVHFRAGNRSPKKWTDPPRHGLADLPSFLECASEVERRLQWRSEDVSWYLAADTSEVATVPGFAELQRQGKIAFLSDDDLRPEAAIVHLDRSPMSLAVEGLADTWAQWLTIASADAVVLSASNFGVTAAEAGRVGQAFLGAHGCLPADITAV